MLITVGAERFNRNSRVAPRVSANIDLNCAFFSHSRYIFFFSAEPAMAIKETVFILSIIFLPLLMEARQPVKPEGKHIVRCLLETTSYKQPLCKYSFCVWPAFRLENWHIHLLFLFLVRENRRFHPLSGRPAFSIFGRPFQKFANPLSHFTVIYLWLVVLSSLDGFKLMMLQNPRIN